MPCANCERVLGTVNGNCVEFSDGNAADEIPRRAGVYAIVVRKRGLQIDTIRERLKPLLEHCNTISPEGGRFLQRRLCPLDRIRQHPKCVILYIGRSGTGPDRTLHHRFKEVSGGHPIWPALWALLYHGWKLRFCWRRCKNPKRAECDLMRRFCREHDGSPMKPALNTNWPPKCRRNDLPRE